LCKLPQLSSDKKWSAQAAYAGDVDHSARSRAFNMRTLISLLIAAASAWHVHAGAASDFQSLPKTVASGSVVHLKCGRTYAGTLDLKGRSDITIRTTGSCGKATLIPGEPVNRWRSWRGNIYVADVKKAPIQVLIDEAPLARAHYPNQPVTWAKGKAIGKDRLQAKLPSEDMNGALLVFRANDWMIDERSVIGHADGFTTIGPGNGDSLDLNPTTEFYVEGKLWMLDSAGEWAYSDGKLYVWTPDGKSPDGRTWAISAETAINANHSADVVIDNVRIVGGRHGIVGLSSRKLQVRNAEILHSMEDGIHAGGEDFLVEHSTVAHAGKNGIWGYYGSTGSVIRHSTIVGTGMTAKPKRSKGGIVFELGSGQQILHNRVLNSAYIGIRVHKDAVVAYNEVDRACQVLTDCGGIYTFARDRLPSNVRIEGNTVKNLAHRWAYAIYLDDFANGVAVKRNIMINNPAGMQIHNGFDNVVEGNVFSGSRYQHVLLNETAKAPSIRHNRFAGNIFVAAKDVPVYRLWSHFEDRYVKRFADYDGNIYTAVSQDFAEVAGKGKMSFARWKRVMQQDEASLLRDSLPSHTEAGLKEMVEALPQKKLPALAR
jgi:parallel beta-helix repeat protein